jgi:para-aminobenzoate synthetase / 4-amino-4-deoxychorismate lyase
MLWDHGFAFLSMHLDRMESSAACFDFSFDRASITSQLLERSNRLPPDQRHRVRLQLDSAGRITVTATACLRERSTVSVRFSSERTSSDDVFLRHKTTCRDRYERLHAEARADGFDEILFRNERDEVTEGAISNIFIRSEGRLLTPPLSSGLLPGVFRRHLLEIDATIEERVINLKDLESADAVFLCNAVRGIRQVASLCFDPSLKRIPTTE